MILYSDMETRLVKHFPGYSHFASRTAFFSLAHAMNSTKGRLTEPATPPLPPPMKTMSYFSWPGLVTGGMFVTGLPVENARVIYTVVECVACARWEEERETDLEKTAGSNGGRTEGRGEAESEDR